MSPPKPTSSGQNLIPAGAPAPAGARLKKIGRRVGIILLAALLLLIVVFCLFPVWISNEQGRAYILQRLNNRLAAGGAGNAARLSVDDWSVSWFRGTELKNVRIALPDGTLLFSASRIASGITLWDIFWGNYDLHNSAIDNLHVSITRRADGHNTWESLAPAAGRILPAVRGSVRIGGTGPAGGGGPAPGGAGDSDLILYSAATGETVHYRNLVATITIASPEAPFHLQLSAAGTADSPAPSARPASPASPIAILPSELLINASLPPIRWLATRPISPWALIADMELSATNAPAGLVCDALNLDRAWAEALGQTLETLRFSNHAAAPQEPSRPVLMLRGSGPTVAGAGDTFLDIRFLLRSPDERGENGLLSLSQSGPGSEGFHAEASVRYSRSVGQALRRLHFLLGEAQPNPAGGNVHVVVSSMNLPLSPAGIGSLQDADAEARLTFPAMTLMANPGGVVEQLLNQLAPGGTGSAMAGGSAVPAAAGLLRVQLADGVFAYENFVLALRGTPINFSGTVGLDESVHLQAIIPGVGGSVGLGSGTSQVTVDGTIQHPEVRRAGAASGP